MLKGFQRTLCVSRRAFNLPKLHLVAPSLNKKNPQNTASSNEPLIHENGLYFGKFTKEEYESAKAFVTSQYSKLEQEIKGTHDVRENLGKIPQFPASQASSEKLGSFPPKSPGVNSLLDLFQETIKTTGPISLLAYMRQCLTHPTLGYYTTRDPLDILGGDFITSPEISSVFGEMIGVWLYAVWTSQGQPLSVNVVEFGPGRGTLIHDAMTVFSRFVKKAHKNVEGKIWLIEASPVLRKEQWKALCPAESSFETDSDGFNMSVSKWGNKVTWVDTEKDIKCLPEECNYVLAHEFFDALPIKSFVRMEKGWREHLVEHTQAVVNTQMKLPAASDPKSTSQKSSDSENDTPEELLTEFHLTASIKETPSSAVPKMSPRFANLPVGSRVEICADAELYMSRIMELVNNNSKGQGAALIIDYGPAEEVPLNSLRGIYKHKFVSPFFRPGEVDLSIDVDFGTLKLLAEPHVQAYGPVEQGDWLHTMGAGHRFDQLIKSANLMANKELLYESYLRLTDKEQMGKIYKFLALMPRNSEVPVGFGGSL
ncbi:DUF185-domain-containing protein [Metschnikowia bicuspidata var. bicuspidata NRRL YB-4993]|uniref:Protein arginine methyltransferase NDUFAF7 n=1 Tax=Metschnikowia bicuspidata var. bicuspidata NRRL YB-4993 TaxID=869754 RepID=A0A1A0H6Q9_9ASCO|nr:DUF185-domain-containing protein [Metschnikowia bicuspidata var. bicuspidata NRRL YB-4993]OBA19779.1 DUF185-domain-containing protein [Metschnikowia bicuspidata var. bicuspidata NRRL YB-4993]